MVFCSGNQAQFKYYRNAVRASQGGELPLPYRWQWQLNRWKNSLRSLFGGESEPPRPRLCPACGTLVGISATRCHECGTNLNFSLVAISKGLSEFFGGRAPVTSALLIVNIVMFALSLLRTMNGGRGGGLSFLWNMSGRELYLLGANVPFDSGLWKWWRAATSMFLHGGLIHIGFNMMVLLDIGPVVEEVYGSAQFLFLYLTAGIAGNLLSAWQGHSLSIGASCAILGLIGLMIAITTRRSGAAMQALRSRLISWVVTIFVMGFLPGLNVDNWAHFGGLAAGFGLGKVIADREPSNAGERTRAYALGWLAGIVIIAAFAMMILHIRDPLPQ
jgi:rhomboid protease GluP